MPLTPAASRTRWLRLAIAGLVLIGAAGLWRLQEERNAAAVDAVDAGGPMPPDPRLIVLANQAYPAADGRSNVFDLYAPADFRTRSYPLFIWIHGGGWRGGDKSDWLSRGIAQRAALEGFVVLDVNYVLTAPERPAPFPAATRDIAAFTRWVAEHFGSFNASAASAISIGGHSAGGHLALYEATAPDAPVHFACVVDIAGVADLPGLVPDGAIAAEVLAFAPTPDERRAASPRFRLADWRADHLLIVHALRDPVVPVQQSRDLGAAVAALQPPPTVDYVLPDRGDHDLPRAITDTAVNDFLRDHCR